MTFETNKKTHLRILVAHHVSRIRNGGMSRIMGFTHDQLEAAGHDVEYLCAEDLPARLGGRVARFAFPVLILKRAQRAARAGRPYDVINVHEPLSAAIALAKTFVGDPIVVVTSHGVERRAWEFALEELRLGRGGPQVKTRLLYPSTSLWQSSLGLRHADHVFCLSFEDRDYLQRWFGLPRDRITRIFPGAAPAFGDTGASRRYPDSARRILFAGTWRKNKGIADLVPAFCQLATRRPDTELVILGAGVPDAAVLDAFPPEIRDKVICSQATRDPELPAVYAAADVFVQPSLFEGTPLTLIEAMASGLPIVTTATCGMRDVIEDARNGLLVPIRSPASLAAALERLLDDADLRAQLGRAARSDALQRYTWPVVAAPMRETYERLAKRVS